MSKGPRLCLNMIVKNEEKIIERLLSSVLPYIDSYCICDTGSTDKTQDIIQQFFSKHTISGVLFEEPFQDFGHNRTVALQKCLDMDDVDYILLLDADMMFWIDPQISVQAFKNHLLKCDVFYVFQGNEGFQYKNIRIVKKKPGLSYWGVTHEYLVIPKDSPSQDIPLNQVFIKDIGDGGSKQDKFLRDIELLKKGLEKHPNHSRYLFYLANSYKDSGQYEKAIPVYFERIQAKDWIEEVYYSYYNIGRCYEKLGKLREATIFWQEAYDVFPYRIESLYQLVHHYRAHNKFKLAMVFYQLAKEVEKENKGKTFLFMETDIYHYKLDYEYCIIAFYNKHKASSVCQLSMNLLANEEVLSEYKQSLLTNYRFYTSGIAKKQETVLNSLLDICKKSVSKKPGFRSSSPCLLKIDDHHYVLNIRYVNYNIDKNGVYDNPEHIITHNELTHIHYKKGNWTASKAKALQYDTSLDNYYCGQEDIRLYIHNAHPLQIGYFSNRGLSPQNICIERGVLDKEKVCQYDIITSPTKNPVEKNWVWDSSKEPKYVVYSWYPLTLGTFQEKTLSFVKQNPTPSFFVNLRGSCFGEKFQEEKEIWFMCHYVVNDTRRFYYHIIVVLDLESYELKKYSRMFTFEKCPVEYCLSMHYEKKEDAFVIGYSVNDASTHFICLTKKYLSSLFIQPS